MSIRLPLNDLFVTELGIYGTRVGDWCPGPNNTGYSCILELSGRVYVTVEAASCEIDPLTVVSVTVDDQVVEQFMEWVVEKCVHMDLAGLQL